ncbi:MAG TPA: protein kinase [Candidatus Eisenbacteria bacterium]|nr:protein kinase [Candidatus Eisenbacteria bacterium]
MSIAPGSRLGPYEILAPLGAGGMGEVYRSLDTRLQRGVAVKVISHDASHDSERIRRFEQEARAAGTLSHPNVCAIYDLGTHEGSPFVVMELLEGETLRGVLGSGHLPLKRALTYAAQAAEGLASAHAKGIVHRDLKPENLFVTKEARIKVLDFGLAKLTGAEAPPAPSQSVGATAPGTMTTPGVLLGTVAYMAPEQVRGAAVDARADVFALGVVLYEMLTGKRPFPGSTTADVMSAILHQEPTSLAALRPDSPAQLIWFVRRCLSKDPDRRVQTMLDVRNELEELVQAMDRGTLAESGAQSGAGEPIERQFLLTAAHVRLLSTRSPRLIGYPMTYLDNQRESETLVICLHGIGGDHRRFESVLRPLPYRGIAVTLAGFAPGDSFRPVLPFDDHAQLLRLMLAELVREYRPTRTVLVGYSAGADQFLRMLVAPGGIGVEAAGFVGLGTNVSLDTCFVSKLYAHMEAGNAEAILEALKWLGSGSQSLTTWLMLQTYITQTFLKFGADVEPLKRCSMDLIAPFENGGDPFPEWYRAATQRFQSVRFVFSDAEAAAAEAVLARHLDQNVLGDRYSEKTYVTEKLAHGQLTEPRIAIPHIESVVADLMGKF